jgi:hypothetical protein
MPLTCSHTLLETMYSPLSILSNGGIDGRAGRNRAPQPERTSHLLAALPRYGSCHNRALMPAEMPQLHPTAESLSLMLMAPPFKRCHRELTIETHRSCQCRETASDRMHVPARRYLPHPENDPPMHHRVHGPSVEGAAEPQIAHPMHCSPPDLPAVHRSGRRVRPHNERPSHT